MARLTWSVHLLIILLHTSFLCSLLFASAKEISSNEIKRVSAAEWEKAFNDHPELRDIVQVADNGEVHPYVHSRNRRTIGRVFDMFRGLFDRIFGGKKGGGGGGYGAPQKQQAASYGPPRQKNPSASYGPPRDPKPSYGPQNNPNPGYGAPGPNPRPPAPGPRPQRPQPPRPRPPGPPRQRPRRPQGPRPQAPIQQGYGGPRPARPAPGGYGGPQGPSQPIYGGQQQDQPLGAPIGPANLGGGDLDGYGSPQAPAIGGGDIDGYGSPQAPAIGGGGDIDGYGAPQAPAIGGGDIDGYGSPQAPAIGGGGGGNIDGYGSPQAPAIGGGDIDGYGSPQAPAIGGGNPNLGQYGSPPVPLGGQPNYGNAPQPFRAAPQPNFGNPGPSIQLSVGAPFPAAPIRNSGGPTSASLADSVFRMIPAPNLATGRPPTAEGNNVQGNIDSYGSPQAQVIGGGVRQATDSYGSPQGPNIIAAGAGNNYGSPIAPTASSNPFIKSSAPPLSVYTSQSTFVSQPAGEIIVGSGKAQAPSGDANIITIGGGAAEGTDSYGSPALPIVKDQQQASLPVPDANPDTYGSPSVGPITDIDLPSVIPDAVIPGVEPRVEPADAQIDVYGSQLAPVGTSAPVPQDIIKQIENNLDSFDTSPVANDEGEQGYNVNVPENRLDSSLSGVPEGELVSATEEEDEYDEIEKEVIDDLVDQIKNELGDPTTIKDPEEEKFLKEVINTIEYIENDADVSNEGSSSREGDGQDEYGSASEVDNRGNAVDDEPLFDNIRDSVVDPPATRTPGPTIDLAGGFVDLSNGVLSQQGSDEGKSTPGEINLTGTTTPDALIEYEATTQAPEEEEYEDTYDNTVDQTVSATTAQPQYDEYEESDDSYSDSQEYVDEDDDVDITTSDDEYSEYSDEGEQGYDIKVPENPLDSSLSGFSGMYIFSI